MIAYFFVSSSLLLLTMLIIYFSPCAQKPESKKREPATSCRSLESTDDGSSESSFDRSSYEDNVNAKL